MIFFRYASEKMRAASSAFLLAFLASFAQTLCAGQEIRIGVLGLFHPSEIVLTPKDQEALVVRPGQAATPHRMILNGEPGHRQLVFHLQNDRIVAGSYSAPQWMVTARDGGPVSFAIEAPGKLRRGYRGKLFLEPRQGQIDVVVGMDRETAVASIVGAEMEETAPPEALKAQAVVTRSFLVAGRRHLNFDFCDTTHCQFLRSPPPAASRIWSAVESTRGIVISYRGKPLAAMFSSRCGGKTRSLREAGYDVSAGDYPYYSVSCDWCLHHPLVWQRHLNRDRDLPPPGDERKRIAKVRQWGWSSIPGNDFSATGDAAGWRIEGHNAGHGIGMCQYGAIGMAESGADFRRILAYYYPNTSLTEVENAG